MKRLLFFVSLSLIALYGLDASAQEWYLQGEDLDIFVKEVGTGKDTVIVVHGGFGASHGYMMDAIKGLETKFHFILYDQRGSLLSPAKKEHLTFQRNVEDLYALVRALKLQGVNLFCHSMGTLVGMEFTRQHPKRVDHLVLAGTILPKSDSLQSVFSPRYEQQVDFLRHREEVMALIRPFKERGIDRLKTLKDIEALGVTHKDLTEYWRINFAAVNIFDIRKYVMTETVDWNFDYRPLLNEEVKTTIINGDYDFFDFHAKILKVLLNAYPNIHLMLIPAAGHNSWIDQPDQFKAGLSAALTR